jgi:hypothetical protein
VSAAQAFAAGEAVKSGDFDRYLVGLLTSIRQRLALIDHTRSPSRVGLESHQVWAWMNGPGTPHWEIRGTGAIWPDPAQPEPQDGAR